MSLFKVVDNVGRKLFEGLEKDARHFVENNFPRMHVQPGNESMDVKPDVTLHGPDGSTDTFNSGWESDKPAPAHAAPEEEEV